MQVNQTTSARSLAMVVSGNCVRLDGILFDVVRARCADLGLAVGDLVRVTGRTAVHMALQTTRGTVALIERELAQFISVGDASPARRRLASGNGIHGNCSTLGLV